MVAVLQLVPSVSPARPAVATVLLWAVEDSSVSSRRVRPAVAKAVCWRSPARSAVARVRFRRLSIFPLRSRPGVDNGSHLRVSGKGAGGIRGGSNGDLYVVLGVRDSDIFERDGLDLGVDIPVSPMTAALGGEVEVPTPEGTATLKIPAGTPNGKLFRLRGKGVPNLRGGYAGDLTARIVIEVPANLDRKQRAVLEEFQKIAKDSTFPEAQSLSNKVKVFYSHRDKLRK